MNKIVVKKWAVPYQVYLRAKKGGLPCSKEDNKYYVWQELTSAPNGAPVAFGEVKHTREAPDVLLKALAWFYSTKTDYWLLMNKKWSHWDYDGTTYRWYNQWNRAGLPITPEQIKFADKYLVWDRKYGKSAWQIARREDINEYMKEYMREYHKENKS